MTKLFKLLSVILFSSAVSADYAECILESMKVVASDVSAAEVKSSCEMLWLASEQDIEMPTHQGTRSDSSALGKASAATESQISPSWEPMEQAENVNTADENKHVAPLSSEDQELTAILSLDIDPFQKFVMAVGDEQVDSVICAFHSSDCIPEAFKSWEKLRLGKAQYRSEPSLFWDGRLFRVGQEISSRAYSGELKHYFPSGQVAARVQLREGRLNGVFERWYETGETGIKGQYKKGYISGPYQEFFKNGNIRAETVMNKGEPSKRMRLWYSNGQLKSDFKMTSSGSNNSLGKAWYEDGSLAFEGKFSRGLVFGTHKIFHPNGNLMLEYQLIPDLADPCPVRRTIGSDYGGVVRPDYRCGKFGLGLVKKFAKKFDANGELVWKSSKDKLWLVRGGSTMTEIPL